MNQHFITGNLVRDPETGTTPAGVGWTRFTVAVRKRFPKEGEPDAEFIRVTAWRGLGENCAKYLGKGKKVAVYGESRSSAWVSRDGGARGQIELTADNVEFLDGGRHGSGEPTDADAPPESGGRRTDGPDWERTDGAAAGDNVAGAGTGAAAAGSGGAWASRASGTAGRQVGFTEVQDETVPY